jgi:hypothetical protein
MDDLESYKLWYVLAGITGLVVLYYVGTRGVFLLTQRWSDWKRRTALTLSFAVLFAPSIAGIGSHGGIMPVPAWVTAIDTANRGRWHDFLTWGLSPIAVTWAVLFLLVCLSHLMSNNKNNKVDTNARKEE